MNSKFRSAVVMAFALVVTAALLSPLERAAAGFFPSRTVNGEQWSALSGRGGSLAILGGLRAVVAGGFWLRTNLAWEREDVQATMTLIELTVAADERPLYFWLNGARMIAYDMPEWQRARPPAPEAVRRETSRRQARTALGFLEKGLRWHGPNAAIYVEMANLYLRRLGDVEAAARHYRLAAEQPGAPYYAGRIYGGLLSELGRDDEALAWLRSIVEALPPDDPAARRAVVEERIRALEKTAVPRRR